MLIRVSSDWHMGNGGRSDDFKGLDAKGLRFIEGCIRDRALMVLAGDTFDLWQANFRDIITAHMEVWQAIRRANHLILAGNHDSDILDILPGLANVSRYYFSEYAVMLHGDEFDRFNRPGAIIGKLVTRIGGWLEHIYPKLDNTNYKFWREGVDYYNRHVARLSYDYGRMVGVYGHTHNAGISTVAINSSSVVVANPGSPLNGTFNYVEFSNGVPAMCTQI
jgi:hypothetical protein